MDLRHALTKNRAEEFGPELRNHFVVPPYFDSLDLLSARKPRVIAGGRGCGKTMLLRYLSFDSQLEGCDPNELHRNLKDIGLYWRVDSQVCWQMEGRGIPQDDWTNAFDHLLALVIASEIINFLQLLDEKSIALSSTGEGSPMREIDFASLRSSQPASSTNSLSHYAQWLQNELWDFEVWLRNLRRKPIPEFLPGRAYLERLIDCIRSECALLASTNFCVFIDEYENLTNLQKRVVNNHMKFSETPMVFHVALKRNSFNIRDTLSEQALSETHDFRNVDLEELVSGETFDIFAGEILLSEMELSGYSFGESVVRKLRDPNRLPERRGKEHISQIRRYTETLLPSPTTADILEEFFSDSGLVNRLRKDIHDGISNETDLGVDDYFDSHFKAPSVVNGALLNRKQSDPTTLKNLFAELKRGDIEAKRRYDSWIHNTLFGCLLRYYEPYKKRCPLYAGFRTYCRLASNNIRHFLELCNKCLLLAETRGAAQVECIDWDTQAEAAKLASKTLLGEIKSFGKRGEALYAIAVRLGFVFNLAQRRTSQSEPEINQFCIVKGNERLSNEAKIILEEAVRYSVIRRYDNTKIKDTANVSDYDYALNPIYAPFFYISYRRKRKMDLSTSDVNVITSGSVEEYRSLMKGLNEQWLVHSSKALGDLFD